MLLQKLGKATDEIVILKSSSCFHNRCILYTLLRTQYPFELDLGPPYCLYDFGMSFDRRYLGSKRTFEAQISIHCDTKQNSVPRVYSVCNRFHEKLNLCIPE